MVKFIEFLKSMIFLCNALSNHHKDKINILLGVWQFAGEIALHGRMYAGSLVSREVQGLGEHVPLDWTLTTYHCAPTCS